MNDKGRGNSMLLTEKDKLLLQNIVQCDLNKQKNIAIVFSFLSFIPLILILIIRFSVEMFIVGMAIQLPLLLISFFIFSKIKLYYLIKFLKFNEKNQEGV